MKDKQVRKRLAETGSGLMKTIAIATFDRLLTGCAKLYSTLTLIPVYGIFYFNLRKNSKQIALYQVQVFLLLIKFLGHMTPKLYMNRV